MKGFLAAVSFLTILPVSRWRKASETDLASGVPWFPVIGLAIGISAALIYTALRFVLPVLPSAVLVTLFLIAASGGLHMDGLADTADGFFSARKRERILEIMRDSRIGTMGVLAVAGVLLLKIALLISTAPDLLWRVFLFMPLAGRTSLLVQMALLSYARGESGGGSATAFSRPGAPAALGGAALLLLSGSLAAGWTGLLSGVASLLAAALFCIYVRKKIGGYTGDTLGAGCELVEIVPPLVSALSGSFPAGFAYTLF